MDGVSYSLEDIVQSLEALLSVVEIVRLVLTLNRQYGHCSRHTSSDISSGIYVSPRIPPVQAEIEWGVINIGIRSC